MLKYCLMVCESVWGREVGGELARGRLLGWACGRLNFGGRWTSSLPPGTDTFHQSFISWPQIWESESDWPLLKKSTGEMGSVNWGGRLNFDGPLLPERLRIPNSVNLVWTFTLHTYKMLNQNALYCRQTQICWFDHQDKGGPLLSWIKLYYL